MQTEKRMEGGARASPPGASLIACPEAGCGFRTSSLRKLGRHRSVTHADTKYACDLCSFVTGYQSNFYRHRKQVTSPRPLPSSLCPLPPTPIPSRLNRATCWASQQAGGHLSLEQATCCWPLAGLSLVITRKSSAEACESGCVCCWGLLTARWGSVFVAGGLLGRGAAGPAAGRREVQSRWLLGLLAEWGRGSGR